MKTEKPKPTESEVELELLNTAFNEFERAVAKLEARRAELQDVLRSAHKFGPCTSRKRAAAQRAVLDAKMAGEQYRQTSTIWHKTQSA